MPDTSRLIARELLLDLMAIRRNASRKEAAERLTQIIQQSATRQTSITPGQAETEELKSRALEAIGRLKAAYEAHEALVPDRLWSDVVNLVYLWRVQKGD